MVFYLQKKKLHLIIIIFVEIKAFFIDKSNSRTNGAILKGLRTPSPHHDMLHLLQKSLSVSTILQVSW